MLAVVSAIIAIGLWSLPAAAQIDLHRFWDGRCHDCHGHAGEFARKHLIVEQGVLVSRHRSLDIRRFLTQHEAGAAQADAIYRMLLAQAQAKPVYQQKCAGCHGNAADFARSSLTEKDGVVAGRSNAQPISAFLKRHGKLAADEVDVVVSSLQRVLTEIGSIKAK